MTDERRRWVIYDQFGVPNRWYAQPLYLGLGFLGASCVAQTASAIFWMSRGSGWFDSAGGQQAPPAELASE